MRDILRKYQPTRIEDLCALNALYRPGPIQGGMVDDFIDRKHGRKQVTYDFPELKELLEETYGVIVYQEQVMQISNRLAGYSLGEADILRRAMGKKKAEEMAAQRVRFLEGAKAKGLAPKKVEKIFDLMEQFAGYGFNKSHSAAYAYLAYVTAYLKAHYPLEFLSALLTSETGNTDKVVKYINECREMGIPVLPPDVNSSGRDFSPDGQGIRMGLCAIRNVGAGAADAIIAARESGGPFQSLYDLCERVDLTSVNQAHSRKPHQERRAGQPGRESRAIDGGDRERDGERASAPGRIARAAKPDCSAWPPASPSRWSIPCPLLPDWTPQQKLSGEKEVLGIYVTGHPLDEFSDKVAELATHDTETLEGLESGAEVAHLRHSDGHCAQAQQRTESCGRPCGWRIARAEWRPWSSPRNTIACSRTWWRIKRCWCAGWCCRRTMLRPRSRSRTSCR